MADTGNIQTVLEDVFERARLQVDEVRDNPDLIQALGEKKGLAVGAAAGALAMMLLGGGRPGKAVKNTIKLGGLALIGGLSYKAYRNWQQARDARDMAEFDELTAAEDGAFADIDTQSARLSEVLLKVMIATAKADGVVTTEERMLILEELERLGYDGNQRAFVEAEIKADHDMSALVAKVRSIEEAAEVYTAALLVTGVIDNQLEMDWLAGLSEVLGLEADLVEHLHGVVDQAIVPVK